MMSAKAAEEIRALLGRRGMNKAELARRLEVSHTWVTNRLTGDQEIGVNELHRIAQALGVKARDLLPAGDTETYLPTKIVSRRAMNRRISTRPGDGRPIGHPSGSTKPDGSTRTSRVAERQTYSPYGLTRGA